MTSIYKILQESFQGVRVLLIGVDGQQPGARQRDGHRLGHLGRELPQHDPVGIGRFASDQADDALWARLHRHFTEPELVDLGCAIGFELGQQHWRRSVGLRARG